MYNFLFLSMMRNKLRDLTTEEIKVYGNQLLDAVNYFGRVRKKS